MADERVTLTLGDDGVAQVRLNRPDKMNALDPAMFDALIAAGEALRTMPGLRAVVLAGEGRAFCAGLDLGSFAAGGSDPTRNLAERTHGNANRVQEAAMTWRKCPVPVIAAVHGVCFGGGLQIASGADIRVVHPAARLAIMEMRWGLVPDMGGYALWRTLVRGDMLRELVYSNREFSGTEALGLGLATFVESDPLARAQAIAAEIAARNPEAVRAAKRLFDVMDNEDTDSILLAESRAQDGVIRRPNHVEAVLAGTQKRAAVFSDV
jgi:enoyl-CoA hydratase/carnithine racemase